MQLRSTEGVVVKPVKVAFQCDPDLYERFRRIYPDHGDVSKFFRRVVTRVVHRVEAEGTAGLGQKVADITNDVVDNDLDKGRI